MKTEKDVRIPAEQSDISTLTARDDRSCSLADSDIRQTKWLPYLALSVKQLDALPRL